jgi:hypothetical protein
MTPKITLISAVVSAAFVLAVPALGDPWGADRNQASVHVSPDLVDRAAAVRQEELFAVLDARERSSAAGRMRGCTDLGLVLDYKNGCVSPRTAQHGRQGAASSTGGASVKRGCNDFGLIWDSRYGCVAPRLVQVSVAASGFHWRDAGIGAGAMLGIVLIVAGLGSAHVARAHHRRLTSS